MKKLNLSLAAIFAMGTFAVAGGDIAPVEPVVEEPVVVESAGNFYLGLAYGYLDTTEDYTELVSGGTLKTSVIDENFDDIMIQAGYNFNEYIAIEGRYWFGLSDTSISYNGNAWDVSLDAWGIYVKPQYPVTEAFNVYALLGYGGAEFDISRTRGNTTFTPNTDTMDGFSWGLGASYAFTDNVSVFIDYVNIYDDTTDLIGGSYDDTIDSWNFGVTYNF